MLFGLQVESEGNIHNGYGGDVDAGEEGEEQMKKGRMSKRIEVHLSHIHGTRFQDSHTLTFDFISDLSLVLHCALHMLFVENTRKIVGEAVLEGVHELPVGKPSCITLQ